MGGLVKAVNRQVARWVPPRSRRRLARLLPARTFDWLRRRRTDVFLVSFPKCGRTWLRVMVGRAFQCHFGLPGDVNLVELHRLADLDPRVPSVFATHDDDAQWKLPDQVTRSKDRFRDTRVLLLVRDPRDVIVSLYYQKRDRRRGYSGSLAEFLDDPVGGFESLLRFYDAWASNLDVPSAVLVVRYEDLHADPEAELRRVLAFVGVPDVTDSVVAEAVAFGSFENMRRLEEADAFASEKLRPGRVGEYESYKTRRGQVGGYRDELTEAQIAQFDQQMSASDIARFGYAVGSP